MVAIPFLGLHRDHTGPLVTYAQENPEREEQPERAPAGMAGPLAAWPLVAESIFLMFTLLQCLQRMVSMAEAISTRLSNVCLQSSHLNS